MNILLSPQYNENQQIHYRFNEEEITVTIGGTTDIFDFNGLPIGEAGGIETFLPINPIVRAERKDNGQMYVELVNFISDDASDSEKFPQWMVV